MISGRLRHRVRVEELDGTRNAYGEESLSWQLVKVVYASIEPVRAYEIEESDHRGMILTHRIRMRYQSGITEKMRIAFKDRVFNITSITNTREINRELVLLCQEENI